MTPIEEDIENYLESLRQVGNISDLEQAELDRCSEIIIQYLERKYWSRSLTRELTDVIVRDFGNQLQRVTDIPFIVSINVDRSGGQLDMRAFRKPGP